MRYWTYEENVGTRVTGHTKYRCVWREDQGGFWVYNGDLGLRKRICRMRRAGLLDEWGCGGRVVRYVLRDEERFGICGTGDSVIDWVREIFQ